MAVLVLYEHKAMPPGSVGIHDDDHVYVLSHPSEVLHLREPRPLGSTSAAGGLP
jgi:hypothetical protein